MAALISQGPRFATLIEQCEIGRFRHPPSIHLQVRSIYRSTVSSLLGVVRRLLLFCRMTRLSNFCLKRVAIFALALRHEVNTALNDVERVFVLNATGRPRTLNSRSKRCGARCLVGTGTYRRKSHCFTGSRRRRWGPGWIATAGRASSCRTSRRR